MGTSDKPNEDTRSEEREINYVKLARQIVEEAGTDDAKDLELMKKCDLTDKQRMTLATFIGYESRKQEKNRAIAKLYRHLQETGRSGVIIEENDEGDEVLGEHEREFLAKEESTDSDGFATEVTKMTITMDGKEIGILEITACEDPRNRYTDRVFVPAEGVSVYNDQVLKREMR